MSTPKNLILPDPNVLNKVDYGKFVLANLAAKRAKQIKEGAPPLVRIDSNHPLSIALAEIAAGKIKPVLDPNAVAAMEEGFDVPTLDLDDDDFLLPGLDDEDDDDNDNEGDTLTLDDLDDEEEDDSDDDDDDDAKRVAGSGGDSDVDDDDVDVVTDDSDDDGPTISLDDLKEEEDSEDSEPED
ncbi:MAG: DNA-directed RNA polymerase subunit omega [Fimbriimonadaceae bacterium]|nr:DNA-directed RNA polymerase subunit omega [Fimbriimonadaceae bacterium]